MHVCPRNITLQCDGGYKYMKGEEVFNGSRTLQTMKLGGKLKESCMMKQHYEDRGKKTD